MDFKLVSKNNIGVVVALLLVVLLSQSKVFNFLLDSALGRSILVFLILVLAYLNKILGIVAVLFIIILFNQSDIGYLEGFTANKETKETKETKVAEKQQIRQNVKANLASKAANSAAPVVHSTTPISSATSSLTTSGAEGFDLIGTENNIKRGKQSNKIQVNEHMRESMNVSAFDGSFTDSYSSF
jgi:hypothetical protein